MRYVLNLPYLYYDGSAENECVPHFPSQLTPSLNSGSEYKLCAGECGEAGEQRRKESVVGRKRYVDGEAEAEGLKRSPAASHVNRINGTFLISVG